MMTIGWIRGLLVLGLGGLLISGCAAGLFKEKTVSERFDTAMKKLAERCAKNPPKSGNTDCDPLKLKPADPLATDEGRFAYSIKIPNPLPEDSGYQPGMTTKEYFDHLCKTEAGEFIFKTVEDVEGIYQMRPRSMATDYELQHLYVIENPYSEYGDESSSEQGYVNPPYSDAVKTDDVKKRGFKLYKPGQNYKFLEKPIRASLQNRASGTMYLRYTRPNTDKMIVENGQHLYPRDQQPQMIEEEVKELRSRFGFTWRGITRPHDRELGIAGGELIIFDLQTNEALGVRRGYLRTTNILETGGRVWWLGAQACPVRPVGSRREFVYKVLKPFKPSN